MKIFCNHDWQVKYETMIESNVERFLKAGVNKLHYFRDDLSATHIVVMACKKCGKIDKTITRT